MQSPRATLLLYRLRRIHSVTKHKPSSNPHATNSNVFLFLPYFLHTLAASGSRMGKGPAKSLEREKTAASGRNLPRYDAPTRGAWNVPRVLCISLDSDQALNPCSISHLQPFLWGQVRDHHTAGGPFVTLRGHPSCFPQKSPISFLPPTMNSFDLETPHILHFFNS